MKNITKLDAQKYEIYFSYVDALTGKRKRVRRRIEGTLQDAVTLRDKLRVKAQGGDLNSSKGLTDKRLKGWLDEYLESRKKAVAASTYKIEEKVFKAFVIKEVGDWKPSHIKLHHLDQLIRKWETLDISQTTVRNRRGMLLRFLRWVLKRIGKNPAFLREVESVSRSKKKKATGRALTPSEARSFLEAVKTHYPHHYPIIFTLLVTGQRWGSVSALRWEDIDDKTITFATSHYRGSVKEGNKSGKVVRIPTPEALQDVLEAHRSKMISEQHVNLSTGLVFPTETKASDSATGGYQVSGDLRHPFEKCCREAGIERITPHDLRRTFNSWTVEAGIDGTIIRSITGHSSETMTDHYYRGSTEGKTKAMGSVLSLVSGMKEGE